MFELLELTIFVVAKTSGFRDPENLLIFAIWWIVLLMQAFFIFRTSFFSKVFFLSKKKELTPREGIEPPNRFRETSLLIFSFQGFRENLSVFGA